MHYLDSIRFLFGDPTKLKASLLDAKNGIKNKPTNIYVDFEFMNDLLGSLHITHDSDLSSDKWRAGYEIIGENGKLEGVISSMVGNGFNFHDSINISLNNDIVIKKKLEGRWFSESFAGPIFSLMNSIKNNHEPETNIYDAFCTIKLVEFVIKSHELNKWIKV